MKKIFLFILLISSLIIIGENIKFDYYVGDTKVGTSIMNFEEKTLTGETESNINIQGQNIKTKSKTIFDSNYIFKSYELNMLINNSQRINLNSKYDGEKIKNTFNGINLPEISTNNKVHIIDNGFVLEHLYVLTKINSYSNKSFIPQLVLANKNSIYDFNAEKKDNEIIITYANVKLFIKMDNNKIKSIEIPAQGAKLVNQNYPIVKENKPFNEKEVSFNSNGLEIPGTLIIPENSNNKLILFVQGSGPSDRDETLQENNYVIKPFKDLAENLAGKGYASFRYDKRSYLYMTKNINKSLDPIEFINDAKNAYNYITKNYNFNEIILLGHSQGGSFVPLIVKNTNIKKAIALSPGTEEFMNQMIYQLNYQIDYFKKLDNPEQYKTSIDQLKEMIKQIEDVNNNIKTGNYRKDEKVLGADYDFLLKINDLTKNTISNFEKIKIPTLIINGTIDLKTPYEKLKEYENDLLKNKYITIKYIDGMGHMLNIVGTLKQSEELQNIIDNWIGEN